jgi:CheY-like chemotaxis protein
MIDRIVAEIKKLSPNPIRFVVNTHVHGDHTGGDENLGKMGASSVPIVALTADALDGSRELSLAAGMNDHLTKPLSLRVLTAKLVEWLGRGSSEDREVDTAVGAPPVR